MRPAETWSMPAATAAPTAHSSPVSVPMPPARAGHVEIDAHETVGACVGQDPRHRGFASLVDGDSLACEGGKRPSPDPAHDQTVQLPSLEESKGTAGPVLPVVVVVLDAFDLLGLGVEEGEPGRAAEVGAESRLGALIIEGGNAESHGRFPCRGG